MDSFILQGQKIPLCPGFRMMKINGEMFPMLQTQEQLSLSANKVHKFVCTVIRTAEFYTWRILLTLYWFI